MGMAEATKATGEQWGRLGRMVRARREELKLSQAEVQEAGGPSDVIQSRIENNDGTKPRPRGSTLRMLDAALRWEPGSAIDILTGGSPTPIGTAGSIRDASDMELLAEVQRRMGGGSFPHRDAYDPKESPL